MLNLLISIIKSLKFIWKAVTVAFLLGPVPLMLQAPRKIGGFPRLSGLDGRRYASIFV
jgi:hypothetical protein